MRAGITAAEAEPPADPELLFTHAYVDPPPNLRMAELTLVEAVNDALHAELERDGNVMVLGEDVGRAGGVFRATAGCSTGSARTAASTRRSPRPGSSAPPSASAWPAGGPSARCSTTRSRIRASTS